MRKTPFKCLGKLPISITGLDAGNLYHDYHGVELYKSNYIGDMAEYVLNCLYPNATVKIVNARIHNMKPGVQLKRHVDRSLSDKAYKVVHVVLKTNKKATLSVEYKDKVITKHLRKGHAYEFNNNYPHWGENAGKEERIHLFIECFIFSKSK